MPIPTRISQLNDILGRGDIVLPQEKRKPSLSTRDNMKYLQEQGILDKIDSAIRTEREAGKSVGPITASEFLRRVMANLTPAPGDVKQVYDVGKKVVTDPKGSGDKVNSALDALMKEVITHPERIAEHPPAFKDLAPAVAATLPIGALQGWRHGIPMDVRAYAHHATGIQTPFTYATKAEKAALEQMANQKIMEDMENMSLIIESNKIAATDRHNVRHMTEKEALKYIDEGRESKYPIDVLTDKYTPINMEMSGKRYYRNIETGKLVTPSEMAKKIKRELIAMIRIYSPRQNITEDLPKLAGKNAREEFLNASGDDPKGYYTEYLRTTRSADKARLNPGTTFGKLYIEPKNVKGNISAKGVSDVYKFYPQVYNMKEKTGLAKYLEVAKLFGKSGDKVLRDIKAGGSPITAIRDALGSRELGFRLPRQFAFDLPATIIDIPFEGKRKLNAYDRMARFLSVQAALKDALKEDREKK